MDLTLTEWIVSGLVYVAAGVFVYGVVRLVWAVIRSPRVRKWLGLGLVAAAIGGSMPGTADAAWEVRHMCGERAAGVRVVEAMGQRVGVDTGKAGSWRLWTMRLCTTVEFDMREGEGDRPFRILAPATLDFQFSPLARAHWDADQCETWQYRREEDGRIAVVGKCRLKYYLLPLGSRFNLLWWTKPIYHTFLVGARGYQDFPLPYWIDPRNEEALEYLPGPDDLSENQLMGELERLRSER